MNFFIGYMIFATIFGIAIIIGTYISNRKPESSPFRKWWEKHVIDKDPYHE